MMYGAIRSLPATPGKPGHTAYTNVNAALFFLLYLTNFTTMRTTQIIQKESVLLGLVLLVGLTFCLCSVLLLR